MNEYDISEAFRAIENELIDSMIRNMERHRAEENKEGILWSQWQAEQLKCLEQYKRVNQKKYSVQFRSINSQIGVLIEAAREAGNMDQEIEILEAIKNGFKGYKRTSHTMQAEFFRINDRKLEALVKATADDMKKAETAILRMANDQYRKVIFNAQVYANTGAGTYAKAVDMATKDMLAAGLNCVEYKNGARHRLDEYADMALRTASKRAYLTGEGEMRQKWNITTVIMNKRGNPCPKCLPFCGKVLIDDVWSGGSPEDGSYPLMSKAVEAGLYHPRCKDSHTTYFPGISTADDTWTREELEAIGQQSKEEARQQYAERQTEKYERLEKYSIDPENKEKYHVKADGWRKEAQSIENVENRDIISDSGKAFESKTYTASVKAEEFKIYKDKIETAVVLDGSGKVIFRESSGAPNYVKFSADQLAKMNGMTLTHNHPSNSTFSSEDIALLVVNKLKSIRATGESRTYQLSKVGKDSIGKDFAVDFKKAMRENKKITDAEYDKIKRNCERGNISFVEFEQEIRGLNKKLNNLNSEWLKENAKAYGYRYSVIERR